MTENRAEKIAVRRKRLRFRAQRRGFKEVDLIFGTFAATWLETLDEDELDRFEMLLDAPDHEVFDWLQDSAPVPSSYDNSVFARMKALCHRKAPTWNA
jgi:antitoxin CptB